MRKPKVDLKNQLARALADYDNLKKRTEIEKAQFRRLANLELVIRLLPVLDMLEQAQTHLADSGLAIAIKEFKDVLNQEGLVEIPTQPGDAFDEALHEAVEVEEGKDWGKIKEVLLTGWRVSEGPVVRHAKVRVTRSVILSEVEGSNK